MSSTVRSLAAIALGAVAAAASGETHTRARDLGVPFEGVPGRYNAITDVAGVEVGHATIIAGEGSLEVGKGPIRTGVTAIHPLGKSSVDSVAAGYYSLNGTGEMTGAILIDEHGVFYGPVMITNTLSIGSVRNGVIAWSLKNFDDEAALYQRSLPVIAETWDGGLNDIWGLHVKEEHVVEALDSARSGPVAEGNVGGGTGMIVYGVKGGIGTSSRVVSERAGGHTVGVLVQANHGSLDELTVAGVPVGRQLAAERRRSPVAGPAAEGEGSIIIVVATDAPLLPTHLKRIARRASLGLARTGSIAHHWSGDIILAFSTHNRLDPGERAIEPWEAVPGEQFNALFEATVQATEEAVINAAVAAETMTGKNGLTVPELPHDRLQEILEQYGRMER